MSAQRKVSEAEAELAKLTVEKQIAELRDKARITTDPAATTKLAADIQNASTKLEAADKALVSARHELATPLSTEYKPRVDVNYPTESSGRRLAFARWLTDSANPLTARVAANHIWIRHFGAGIVPNPADFGRNSKEATNPRLVDWLAAELMSSGWKMKELHRLIVTSSTYRMDSRPDDRMLKLDPDNIYLWRMNSRRLEAEAVRDNVLWVTGGLDETMGGPEIDHNLGLTSRRRSIYLRTAAEKDVAFLKIFDGASVTECYERKQTVMPQQALALANSDLALQRSHAMALFLEMQSGGDLNRFIEEAYLRILSRPPTQDERRLCLRFLNGRSLSTAFHEGSDSAAIPPSNLRARQNLILVLLNHHDFVTVR